MHVRRNGFTLIELMMVVGVSGVLVLGLGSLMSRMYGQVNQAENIAEVQKAVRTVQQALGNPVICNYNLKSPNFSSLTFNTAIQASVIDLTTLQMPAGAASVPVLTVNDNLAKAYWVKRMLVRSFTRIGTSNDFKAELFFQFSQDPPAVAAANGIETRILPIFFTTTTTGTMATLTNCTMGASGPPPPPPPPGVPIFSGWPNYILCDGTAWKVISPGRYACQEGGPSSMNTAGIAYNTATKAYIAGSYDNEAVPECGNSCGTCCTQTIDQMVANGLAKD